MDRNQKQVPAGICLFLEAERFGINFSFTGTGTGIPKSQINFVHERFFAVNRAVFKQLICSVRDYSGDFLLT